MVAPRFGSVESLWWSTRTHPRPRHRPGGRDTRTAHSSLRERRGPRPLTCDARSPPCGPSHMRILNRTVSRNRRWVAPRKWAAGHRHRERDIRRYPRLCLVVWWQRVGGLMAD